MIKKPVGFLSLPRELRDQVYAYLLSTEYNKHEPEVPPFVRAIPNLNYLLRL